ncbi:unnamed protein product [Paramecium octaurelia]|uniref:Uncharacterized protein n=1 Tax=Paramecium octaurelia TaxID=43137 RepID=A0A8S1SVA8_PAROT|nr:unnamed protein product [Paramecium octaurelia]
MMYFSPFKYQLEDQIVIDLYPPWIDKHKYLEHQDYRFFEKLNYKSENLALQNNPEDLRDLMIVLKEKQLYSLEKIQKELIEILENKKKVYNLELDDLITQLKTFFQFFDIKQRKHNIPINFIQQLVDPETNLNQTINALPYWQKTIIQIIKQILLKYQLLLKATNKEEILNLIFPTHEECHKSRILIGPTIFGLQNGKFIYIVDGVEKQGGEMQMGKKIGLWKEYGILGDDFISQISLQIQYDQGMIRYIKDGEILKQCNQFDHVLLKNIQQIKYLGWHGNYNNGKKSGKFQIIWKGENLNIGGEYNEKGEKFGLWTELFENYGDQSQVQYIGQYQEGKKCGSWTLQYEKNLETITMPLGKFNEEGLKEGVWLELHENFWDECQVCYTGQYRKGVRNGFWAMRQFIQGRNIIGGGFYNQKGMKSGEWIEWNEGYFEKNLILEVGDYENGRKIGNWYSNKIKITSCLDHHSSERSLNKYHFFGDYKDGVKVGQWDYYLEMNMNKKYKLIGGGIYDDKGMKNGQWIELYKNFENNEEVWFGQYKNGKKFGSWENKTKIFGGVYDSNGVKQGNWRLQNYQQRAFNHQNGQYINGRKIGNWYIRFGHFSESAFCEGQYNHQGMRNGQWKELKNKDNEKCTIIYEGKYDNGFQIGKWDIYDCNQKRHLGGGTYIQEGVKDGIWTELHENFFYRVEVRYDGQYQSGIKIGEWKILRKGMNKQDYKQMGGGSYDDQGMKIGYWQDLQKNQFWNNLVVGSYSQGKKIGIFKKKEVKKKV